MGRSSVAPFALRPLRGEAKGEAGQAAVETLAGVGVLLALAAAVLHLIGLLAAAGALQAQTRETAIREARTSSGAASIERSRSIDSPVVGMGATRLTSRAAIRQPAE